jgi:hypothetical protein
VDSTLLDHTITLRSVMKPEHNPLACQETHSTINEILYYWIVCGWQISSWELIRSGEKRREFKRGDYRREGAFRQTEENLEYRDTMPEDNNSRLHRREKFASPMVPLVPTLDTYLWYKSEMTKKTKDWFIVVTDPQAAHLLSAEWRWCC